MKKKVIQIPIYGGRLTLIKSKDLKDVNKKYDLDFETESYGGIFFSKNKNGNRDYYMAFRKRDVTPGLIAHECLHFVNDVFLDLGIFYSLKDDEPQAYLLLWAVNKCHKFLKK